MSTSNQVAIVTGAGSGIGDALRGAGPAAIGTTGVVRATLIPNTRSADFTVGDLVGYTPSDPAAAANILTVRDRLQSAPVTIPRERWRLVGNVVTLEGGFDPGRTYEIAYAAVNPPVSGLA